jgi:lipopolysaccharide export system protein LptC
MAAAYRTDEHDTRAFQATERGDTARRFRTAARHSRRVRILRIAVPISVVVGGAALALATWFNPLRLLAGLPLSFEDVVISGTKIKMENPKLSGFTRDSRRYDLVAGAAAQDLTRPGMIELQDINAIVEMDQNESMKVTAATGVLDTKNDKLALDRDIVVTSGGYEGELDEAVIDTKSGNVVSEKPVKVRMLNGTVNANRLEVLQSGNLLRFEKGVVVNMRMNEDSTPAAKPAETPQ